MPKTDPTEAEREVMADLVQRALEAAETPGKAGIAAALMKDGVVLARGENEVHLHDDPTRHAEIVAISRATRALGTPSLKGCVLLSTLQPCEMCLSAMRFAGIDRVIFAADKPRVGAKYFQFAALELPDFEAAGQAPFDWAGGVMAEAVLHLYAEGDE